MISENIFFQMEKITSEWANFENCVGQNVPMFLKLLLWKTGYDSMVSIKQISTHTIRSLEQFVQKRKNQILSDVFRTLELSGGNDHSLNDYKEQEVFEFLPGHRTILLSLRHKIECMQSQAVDLTAVDNENVENMIQGAKYSIVLREFMKTADKNWNKSKPAHRYNDVVKYFSTYIFLLCGRTCYETLNKNLPMPSTKTICE